MWIAISFVMGLLVGIVVCRAYNSNQSVGNLRIDHSDPSEPPYLFLELSDGVHTIINKKTVCFKVRHENFVSQK